jgi:hypothetical protein
MHILFVISMFCLFALVLATVAIARHVRARGVSANRQPDFARHLFAAAADRDSRTQPLTNLGNPSISSKRF